MGETTVGQHEFRRWRRYGNDRLYVVRAHDGVQLGYWDLIQESPHPELASFQDELSAAVAHWRATSTGGRITPVESRPVAQVAHEVRPAAEQPPAEPDKHRPAADQLAAAPYPDDVNDAQATSVDLGSPSLQPPPVDLAANRAGVSLQAQIDAARAAGQRPTILRRIFLGKHAHSSWERGAVGERLVAAELDKLLKGDPRWMGIHSIPVGRDDADIDHLLIGPAGVFTINSKNHSGMRVWVGGDTFLVNGVRQPHIRNARHEASRAARLLTKASGVTVDVNGMVVPVNAANFVVKSQPRDVTVINRRRLVKHLRRLPEVLAPSTAALIFELARQSSTWRT